MKCRIAPTVLIPISRMIFNSTSQMWIFCERGCPKAGV
jgi:hypothetical protein